MKARIKRLDTTIALPAYKTGGAAAADLSARIDVVIAPGTIGYVPLNVALEPPPGHFVLLAPRSSLHKRGLMSATAAAIIDPDYCGNEDEYHAALHNFTDKEITVLKGERIMQIVFLPFTKVGWEETEDLGNGNRGGFGTTGVK